MIVLVSNLGSTSFKFKLFDMSSDGREAVLADGAADRRRDCDADPPRGGVAESRDIGTGGHIAQASEPQPMSSRR